MLLSERKNRILPNTLSFRLGLWFALFFTLFLISTVLVIYFSIDTLLNQQVDEDLIEDVEELKLLLYKGGELQIIEELNREVASNPPDTFFAQLYAGNSLIFTSDMHNWADTHKPQFQSDNEVQLITVASSDDDHTARAAWAKLSPAYSLYIGESNQDKQDIMELILTVILAVVVVMIPLAILISWLLSRQTTKGILAVAHANFDIEKGEFNRQVALTGQYDEVQILIDTFNRMAQRIHQLVKEMQEMIDNIAHDLRSPIARIRVIAETSLLKNNSIDDFQEAASDTLEECDRLIHLINTTLDVAEAEAGINFSKPQRLDLSSIVANLIELYEIAAEQKNIKIIKSLQDDCYLYGDPSAIERAIANMIDNALKYTDKNGKVVIELTKDNSSFLLQITDSGIGIPAKDLNSVFQRFYRCDNSRNKSGCGLGLSFAHAVVHAHHGKIDLQSTVDKGSQFTITFPMHHV